MKAVVLAGGRGERLSPVTDTRPKPLVPVLARPVMDYILSLLAHHGFEKAILTTHYRAEEIRERYGDRAFGLSLSYAREKAPLGTCGGVKALEKELRGEREFLVIAGDALCDFDLGGVLAFHREKRADVTIVLSGVETPLEYGVVPLSPAGRVTGFSEKPDWSETLSEWVNTGVYVLSPRVLDLVPEGAPFDFAGDLFPLLLKNGFSLYGYKSEGYWCDVGQLSSLFRCNRDLLAGKAEHFLPRDGSEIQTPGGTSYVAAGAEVAQGAVLDRGSVLSPGARVEKGARLADTLVMENVTVGEGAVVRGAILCENVTLGAGSLVAPDCVLGAGSVVEPGAAVPEKTVLPPGSRVAARPAFEGADLAFTEIGSVFGRSGLDEAGVLELARRAAHILKGRAGVLARAGDRRARLYASLLENALAENGANVFSFGDGTRAMASFLSGEMRVPAFYAESHGGKGYFFGFEADSLPFLRSTAAAFSRPRAGKAEKEGFVWPLADAAARYVSYLAGVIGEKDGAVFIEGEEEEARLFRLAAGKAGLALEEDAPLRLSFAPDAFSVAALRAKLDLSRARTFVVLSEWESGKRVFAVPEKEDPLLQALLRQKGCRILPFSLAHTAREEKDARALAAKSARFFWDRAALAAQVLSRIDPKDPAGAAAAFARVPVRYRSTLQYFPRENDRAKIIPAALALEDDFVRVAPGAFAIRILSEAWSAEAAEDRMNEIRGKLHEIEKRNG